MSNWTTLYGSGATRPLLQTPEVAPAPLMSDSRLTTSWQPEAIMNQRLQQQAGITTNWEYRKYLQSHAGDIQTFNRLQIEAQNPPTAQSQPLSNVPFLFTRTFDTSQPDIGYTPSDLKHSYLSREQLQARMVSPTILVSPPPPTLQRNA